MPEKRWLDVVKADMKDNEHTQNDSEYRPKSR